MNELELQEYLKAEYAKENEFCEWKEFKNLKHSISGDNGKDLISYISAISNMGGGHIVIGVRDKTLCIVGIQSFHDYTTENIRLRLLRRCSNLNSEGLRVEAFITEDTGKTVWVFHIPKHRWRLPVYAHDKAWQRIDDSLVEMRPERLDMILKESAEERGDGEGMADGRPLTESGGEKGRQSNSVFDIFGRVMVNARRTFIVKMPFTVNIMFIFGVSLFLLSILIIILDILFDYPFGHEFNSIKMAIIPFGGIITLFGIVLKFKSSSFGVSFLGNIERGNDGNVYLTRVSGSCPFCPGRMRMLGASERNKDHTLVCNRNSEHRLVFDMTTLIDVADDYIGRGA